MRDTYNIQLSNIIMFKTNAQSKLYLCHFNKQEVTMKLLNTIKVIHHHIIKWLPYKPKYGSPTQCYHCCMYGHGARSCNRYAVCMLCSGNHVTKECTVISPSTENPTYKCYNCASASLPHNHKANDPACPFRTKYETAKEKARNKNKQKSTASHTIERKSTHNDHRFVRAPQPTPLKRSFAEVTASQPNATSYYSTSTNERTPTNENNDLWSIAEVSDLLLLSINDLKKCKSKLEQLSVIANLLKHACK